jgi:hypothetical protein
MADVFAEEKVGSGWASVHRGRAWLRWFKLYLRAALRSEITSKTDGRMLAVEAERFASQVSRNHV